MKQDVCKGDLPSVVRNDAGLYEGNLTHYFRVVFYHAQNLRHPYHNFRHMTHVMWLCHLACGYYRSDLSPREMRNLLIAALFHDFDHTGRAGIDDVNISLAVRGIRAHVLDEDREFLEDIVQLIQSTQFPYVVKEGELDLSGLILRDADISQAMSVAWIQQVIFGLAAESGKSASEIFAIQAPFLKGIAFHTKWARERFPDTDIAAKVQEATDLVLLLDIKYHPLV